MLAHKLSRCFVLVVAALLSSAETLSAQEKSPEDFIFHWFKARCMNSEASDHRIEETLITTEIAPLSIEELRSFSLPGLFSSVGQGWSFRNERLFVEGHLVLGNDAGAFGAPIPARCAIQVSNADAIAISRLFNRDPEFRLTESVAYSELEFEEIYETPNLPGFRATLTYRSFDFWGSTTAIISTYVPS
jgi:hypothetical protein